MGITTTSNAAIPRRAPRPNIRSCSVSRCGVCLGAVDSPATVRGTLGREAEAFDLRVTVIAQPLCLNYKGEAGGMFSCGGV